MAIQPFVDAFNAIEVALWIGMAIAIFWRSTPPRRWTTYAWCSSLFLFGLSDLVELKTGAFWRPWWLLLWKSLCIAAFLFIWRFGMRPATDDRTSEQTDKFA